MKKIILYVLAGAAAFVAIGGAVAVANTITQSRLLWPGDTFTANATRACMFPKGGWTIVDCSNVAAAQSAELNAYSRYVVQCLDDSYFATGDESTDEADSSDGYLPAGSWLEMLTTASERYFSCLNLNVDSDCRYIECQ